MSFLPSVLLSMSFLVFYPHSITSYNTNRQIVLVENNADANNCDYYENPVFQTLPSLVQSRMGDLYTVKPVGIISNRFQKEPAYFNPPESQNTFHPDLVSLLGTKYQPKPLLSLFPNVSPANSGELISISPRDEDEEEDLNYDKLWKVGEMPPASASSVMFPNAYVKLSEDTPPFVDQLNIEQSELTEETHHIEDVELEEKLLNDPAGQVREVFFERVTTRPEIPLTESPEIVRFRKMNAEGVALLSGERNMSIGGVAGVKKQSNVVKEKVKKVEENKKEENKDKEKKEEVKKVEEAVTTPAPKIAGESSLPLENVKTEVEEEKKDKESGSVLL